MGSMRNAKQIESIIKALTEELGRMPTSVELLWAINGNFKPKDKDNG